MGRTRKGTLRRKNSLSQGPSSIKGIFYFYFLLKTLVDSPGLVRMRSRVHQGAETGSQNSVRSPTYHVCLGTLLTLKGFYFFLEAGELSRAAPKGCDFELKKTLHGPIKIF